MALSFSRRRFLISGTTIAAGLAAGASRADEAAAPHAGHGATAAPTVEPDITRDIDPAVLKPLVPPEIRRSDNGVLETTLRASFGPVTIDGETRVTRSFESSYPAPTLVVKPGDTLRIKLINDLDEVTNLHTHGLHVSPAGNSDNVFLNIEPHTEFDIEIKIPADHPAGVYWYHPHVHGETYPQVSGGMAGALIIEGGLDDLPEVGSLTERTLVFQSAQFDADGVVVPADQQDIRLQTRTTNGQINPTIAIRPGEVQRWRVVNATSETFLLLGLEGHPLYQIAKDGNPLTHTQTLDTLLLEPGTRAEILVRGHQFTGAYELRQLLWLGSARQFEPDVLLATLVVDGEPAEGRVPDALLPLSENLRDLPVDRSREIRFDVKRGDGPPRFMFDDKVVDMDRVDQRVEFGAFEEWTIYNDSPEWHIFHIHQNDFQVIKVNGEPVDVLSWEDTRGVSPFGSITIRHRFLDFSGKFVYHCHLLFHEDHGMMGVVEVVEP